MKIRSQANSKKNKEKRKKKKKKKEKKKLQEFQISRSYCLFSTDTTALKGLKARRHADTGSISWCG